MDKRAENVVQGVGALAETTSIFYNTIIKQVPKDVALILTQHFMDISVVRRPMGRQAAAAQANQTLRAAQEIERRRQENEKKENTESGDNSDGKENETEIL